MSSFSRRAEATLLLVGTIVGVGMFGIPFVFARAGVIIGAVELILLAGAMLVVHLAYGGIVAGSRVARHLPGYVAHILGRNAGHVAEFSHVIGLAGTLLAYLVIGGMFAGTLLAAILPGLPAWAGVAVFYGLGIAVISRNIRVEGAANAVLTLGLIGVLLGLSFAIEPSAGRFASHRFAEFFTPYGVILFALAGAAVLPDTRRLLGPRNREQFRNVIIAGTLVPAALYLVFAFAVTGATGDATTPDAISGLAERFGSRFAVVGSLVGFLAAITSFIGIGLTLEGTLMTDFRIQPRHALFVTAVLPIAFYAAGMDDFIRIIGLVGALAVGTDAILILLAHRRLAADGVAPRIAPFTEPVRVATLAVFSFGVAYELIRFLNG